MRKKAVALISGGNDSVLAAKIAMDMGIEIHGLFINTIFFTGRKSERIDKIFEIAKVIKIPLSVLDCGREYLKVLRKPKFGYGRNFNPCIDCHIFFLQKAKQFLSFVDADFIVSGEVAGQRPMSQNIHTLNRIDKNAGVKGLVLRPLSGKILEATEMEKQGIISRDDLLEISGRSRSAQKDLIKEYRLKIKAHSGGGCMLTDPVFSKKISDYFEHYKTDNYGHINLLNVGRHFRLNQNLKLIIGRNEQENNEIERYKELGDIIFPEYEIPGPSGLLIGEYTEQDVEKAAKIVSRYCDGKGEKGIIFKTGKETKTINADELPDQEIEKVRI